MANKKTKHIVVRTDESLHARLTALAAAERRSLNAQILVILEEYLAAHQPPAPTPPAAPRPPAA